MVEIKKSVTLLACLLITLFLSCVFTSLSSLITFVVCLYLCRKCSTSYLLMSVGTLCVIFFYFYWKWSFGSEYFLGMQSDDWHYDNVWTKDYASKHGLNIFYLESFLNRIEPGLGVLHNSKGFLVVIIYLKYFSSFLDGYHTLIPRIINVLLLVKISSYITELYVYYSGVMQRTRYVAITVFFLPVLLLPSMNVFRDVLISFLVVQALWSYELKVHNSLVGKLTLLFTLAALLFYLRASLLFVLIFYLGLQLNNIVKLSLLAVGLSFFGVISDLVNMSFYLRSIEAYDHLNILRFSNVGTKIWSHPFYYGWLGRILFLIFTPALSFSSFYQSLAGISSLVNILSLPFLLSALASKKTPFRLRSLYIVLFLSVAFTTADFRHVTVFAPFGVLLFWLGYVSMKVNTASYFGVVSATCVLFLLFLI